MKPYVLLAERLGYVVNVVEPWEICAKQLGLTRRKAFLQKAFLVGHLLLPISALRRIIRKIMLIYI